MKSIYEELSEERKELQSQDEIPEWFTTSGWQIFTEKYRLEEATIKDTFWRIANCAAKHTNNPNKWGKQFFDILWKGWLAPSTPVLANMGTDRGCPVSCSGNYVSDSVLSFYESIKEVAILSQNGFGTSSYLGAIRPRGSAISKGGKASGILPVLKAMVQTSRDITQGHTRRGAWAGYVDIDHDDVWEIINFLQNNPDDCNIGWNVSQKFIDRLNNNDEKAISKYQRIMKVKMLTGKGYFFFPDKATALNPPCYADKGLNITASQLCLVGNTKIEISLEPSGNNSFLIELEDFNQKFSMGFYDEVYVKSYNTANNSVVFSKILHSAQTGSTSELIEIEDENGNIIRCTEDHKILTKRGYVKAKNLTEEDDIIT